MTVMQLSFRQAPPPISLFWRAKERRGDSAAAPRNATGAITAVIGPRGPAGPPGGGDPFEQVYGSAISWTVNHNLGRSPASVRVLSDGGVEVIADVIELSVNQVVVQFAAPQSGRCVVY